MPGDTTARTSPRAKLPQWELLRALERVAPRFTLGDALLQLPDYAGTADELRAAIVEAAHLAGGWMEQSDGREASDGPDASVVYVFPKSTRAAVLARSADAKRRAAQRRAWRGFLVFLKGVFAFFLVASIVIVFMALVAILIIMLTQGRDRGGGDLPIFGPGGPFPGGGGGGGGPGGPYYHRHGGLDSDFWFYLYMRDIMWFTYWNEHDHRRHLYATGAYGDFRARAAKPGGGGRRPDGGGPAPRGGGPNGPNDPNDPDDPSNDPFNDRFSNGGGGPPTGDPSDLRRFVAEEDRDDAYDFHSGATSRGAKEMTFVEAVFAFVFGRGDPNDDMEHRRWRAVSALLRVNEGAVFAEQVAPFLDEYLLADDAKSERVFARSLRGVVGEVVAVILAALAAVPFAPLAASTRRAWLRRDGGRDGAADASRMHEGYMLRVCAKFGGHAEASEDGRLVYVFPAMQATTIGDDDASARRRPNATDARTSRLDRKRPAVLPPPLPPPLYEKMRPTWEGGEKTGQVAALGALNLFLVVLFKKVGGTDFRARRRPLGVRARATMGRRAGAGLRVGGGARVAGTGARVVVGPSGETSYDGETTNRSASTNRGAAEAARAAVAAARRAGTDLDAAARDAGGEIVYETVPVLIQFLELFPWLCAKTYKALFAYALMFFALPLIRAAHATFENGNIRKRNARRRAAAERALRALVEASRDKRAAAKGKQAMVLVE